MLLSNFPNYSYKINNQISVYFSHKELNGEVLPPNFLFEVSVVIDVLRATSTIVTALNNGAKEIIPFEEIKEALEFKNKINERNLLLCGERGGIKPEGFELGNSPLEFTSEIVKDKSLILTTTNGTRAFLKAFKISNKVYIASFLNVSSTVEILSKYNNIAIVCAGNNGSVSYEDTQLAGFIIEKLLSKKDYSLSDSAKIAYNLWKSLKKPDFTGEHAKKLIELGFQKDVDYCQNIDKISIVCEGIRQPQNLLKVKIIKTKI
ncbi:2-phosphosulfolactate phosphatase [Fervidobacterium nodosum]|uniref:Probable 2-phosphosulfolactate phosphatase n=1 Tax=Fervidobacterium nodosum (strain ATCC 35602 / DSM 5306 / Rt17-B1) TaxID=381764 RepID=A7HKA5_FERNB|nr:2-phosphosulfolactate phosphatase [Fervidobacterium nodosum]ABS60338.1 2-phosphosulfolactate phosphatase [Fervidobacterium nodosum Rt17-B1]